MAPTDDERRPDPGLRPVTLALAAAFALTLGYVVQKWLNDHVGRMPFPDWFGAALLALVAVGVLAAGSPIRRWQAGTLERRLDPIRAFRTLILARAAALAGAVVAGWYAATMAVLAPDAVSDTVKRGMAFAGLYVIDGILLVVVGLLVQSWCRLDPPGDDPDEGLPDLDRGPGVQARDGRG